MLEKTKICGQGARWNRFHQSSWTICASLVEEGGRKRSHQVPFYIYIRGKKDLGWKRIKWKQSGSNIVTYHYTLLHITITAGFVKTSPHSPSFAFLFERHQCCNLVALGSSQADTFLMQRFSGVKCAHLSGATRNKNATRGSWPSY